MSAHGHFVFIIFHTFIAVALPNLCPNTLALLCSKFQQKTVSSYLGLETRQLNTINFAENRPLSSQFISFIFVFSCFILLVLNIYTPVVKMLKILTFDTKVSAKVIKIFTSYLSKMSKYLHRICQKCQNIYIWSVKINLKL